MNFTCASFYGLIVPGGLPPLVIDTKEEVCYNELLGMLNKCFHNRQKKCFQNLWLDLQLN